MLKKKIIIIYSNENELIAKLLKKNNNYYLRINNKNEKNIILFIEYLNRFNISTYFNNNPIKINIKIPCDRYFFTNDKKIIKKLHDSIIYLENKKPIFYPREKKHKMIFINAIVPSIKNFQFIVDNKICFELGKLKKNLFSINFCKPFFILQICGLALSAF